jgi:hypothetical protein
MDVELEPKDSTKPGASGESQQRQVSPRGQRWQVMTEDLDSYFKKGLFVLVNVFIVLAAFGLYFSVNDIIDRWVEYQYVPLVQTIYYVAVIALGLYLMKIYILKNR